MSNYLLSNYEKKRSGVDFISVYILYRICTSVWHITQGLGDNKQLMRLHNFFFLQKFFKMSNKMCDHHAGWSVDGYNGVRMTTCAPALLYQRYRPTVIAMHRISKLGAPHF